jgi:hypothetical protein
MASGRRILTESEYNFRTEPEASAAPQAIARGVKVFWFFFSKKNRFLAHLLSEFCEDLPILVVAHQHRKTRDFFKSQAAWPIRFRVEFDLAVGEAGNFLPFAGGLFNLKGDDRGFEYQADDGLLWRGGFGQAGGAGDDLPAICQGPGGEVFALHGHYCGVALVWPLRVGMVKPFGGAFWPAGAMEPPVTPGVMVLLPAPLVIEAPGNCWRGVPLALMPLTTSMFGPFMEPESALRPELTALPICWAAARLGRYRQKVAARSQRDISFLLLCRVDIAEPTIADAAIRYESDCKNFWPLDADRLVLVGLWTIWQA